MSLTGSDEHFKLTKFGKFYYFESLIIMELQMYDLTERATYIIIIVYLAPW